MPAPPWPRLLACWHGARVRTVLLHSDGRRAHAREDAVSDAVGLTTALAGALAATHRDVRHAALVTDEAMGAEALRAALGLTTLCLLPRDRRSGELADRLNDMPKYVVSSTLEEPDWNNSTVLKGDVVTEVSKLKQELDGEIIVPASYRLGRTLIEHDLVDEVRLVVFPVVLGTGERFFGEASGKKAMRLVDTRTIGDGLAFLTYKFVQDA